jgi:sec-independent protein translocase protein TatA
MFGLGVPEPSIWVIGFGLGIQELLIFMVVVLLLFGSARLPSLMRNLGRSATEFKKGMRDDGDESNKIEGE